MSGRKITFLGPQRRAPSVREALEELLPGDGRPVAAVTAGWEEREGEVDELGEHIERPVANLALHQRAVGLFEHDPELLAGLQAMHDELTELQRLYRLQLRHLAAAAHELLEREGSEALLEDHRDTAFENLRNLDAHHVECVRQIRARVAGDLGLASRDSLAHHKHEIGETLRGAGAVCIAGGHVGVLFNRLWLFDVPSLLPESMPIVAWSAGAMVLSERIVLFHDSPPEGASHAELLGPGFGLYPGVIPFPHARHRLQLVDPDRVRMLARRFPKCACLAFDDGAQATWDGARSTVGGTSRQLSTDGSVVAGGV